MRKPKLLSNLPVASGSIGFVGNNKIYEMHERLIARNEAATEHMAATLTTLGKIMEGTKSMMSNLVQISENNLEAEKLKLRRIEVINPNEDSPVQNIEVDFESKKRKSNDSIDSRKVRVLDTKKK